MTLGLVGHYLGDKMGIGVYLDRLLEPLVRELGERGVDARVIASPNARSQTPVIQRLQQESTQQVAVLPALDYSPIKRFGWVSTQFSSYCKAQGIDHLIWLSNPIVLPWHPPSVAVLHDVNEWKDKEKYGSSLKTTLRSWMYLKASLKWADKIVCISEAGKKDLLYFRPDVEAKVKTIPNGFDSPLSTMTPDEIEAPSAPFLVSVGRIDPVGKKLPEAVALVEALRDLTSTPWELHIFGGMNKSTQSAGEKFLRDIEAIPWIRYHGYTEDATLAAWYREATAVVFLSENEGFGSPVAEAASFGRQVIINANNEASMGAGGEAVIPIKPQEIQTAANTVLEQIKARRDRGEQSSLKVYTYADAAADYAEMLSQWAKG